MTRMRAGASESRSWVRVAETTSMLRRSSSENSAIQSIFSGWSSSPSSADAGDASKKSAASAAPPGRERLRPRLVAVRRASGAEGIGGSLGVSIVEELADYLIILLFEVGSCGQAV